MAARGEGSRAEVILEEAIEDVLRVMQQWARLALVLGLISTGLVVFGMLNRLFIFVHVASTHDMDSLAAALTFMILAGIVAIAFHYLEGRSIGTMSNYLARRLALPAVMATAQRAGMGETIATTAVRDVETMRGALAGPAAGALVHAVVTPPLVVLAFVIHWAFGCLALVFALAAGIMSLLITRAKRRALEIGGAGEARATALAADAMRSGEAVLAMGMLRRLAGQWIGVATTAAGEAWIHERRAARLRTIMDAMLGTYRGCFIVLSSVLALNGEIRTSIALGAMFIMHRIPEPFINIGGNAEQIAAGLTAWDRLKALVRGSPMPPDGLAFPCHEGKLVAEKLAFAFRGPQPPLFRGLDLTVAPGEIIGIIGPSGSGKSTLLRVLIGMYRPNGGGVYLDGCAVHQWDRRDLARHVGFLPQEPLLSRGTAAEVIARLDAPEMPLVLDAARRAGAHETIVRLPLGYATVITGQPQQLSMGQRHRIAIARALYGRPKIVVMDELAASLDTEGEAQIAQLLQVLREEGTSVVFTTHRPGLLAVADRVLTLRDGRLTPTGGEPAPQRLAAGSGSGGGGGNRQARLAAPEAAPEEGGTEDGAGGRGRGGRRARGGTEA